MNEPIFIARQDTLEQEILPAHWLAQYKLFGEESYTFQDKEIWKKLCMSSAAANDRDMHAEALEEMLTTFSAEHTGKWMLTVYGMDAAVLEGRLRAWRRLRQTAQPWRRWQAMRF